MKRSSKRILFIVEGETDEPEFIEQVKSVLFSDYDIDYYTYKTSIHDLVDYLCVDGEFDTDIDIKLALANLDKNEEQKEVLNKKYTDIFLIFDMEPHYQKQRFDQICEMLKFYNDSGDNGKLYINYPMMQSYKHLNEMPDLQFEHKTVSVEEVQNYKALVGTESKYQDLKKYTYEIIMSICAHHLKKMNYILNKSFDVPNLDTFLNFNFISLLEYEINKWETEKKVDVLNTSIFFILEYEPDLILRNLEVHRDSFTI